jgi:deoxycytidine triphosphate deaminase
MLQPSAFASRFYVYDWDRVIHQRRPVPPDFTTLPIDEADAANRASQYAHVDPLKSVPCSLLSSAEVHDYVRLTGMVHPFYEKALKSASYEAHISGLCIWWDENGRRQEVNVGRGDPLVLQANSIKFVQVEPTFRLPDYIAVRFNLRITHVHRGLLLGTGPLVDPGFEGKLLIPLHNLTSSDYDIDTSEALIWIEFTKTTYGVTPTEELASSSRNFVPFPPNKKNLTPDAYLRKANAGNPIRSSIPAAIAQGERMAAASATSAADAVQTARQIRTTVASVGFLAIGALVIALLALYLQMGSLVQNSNALATSVNQTLSTLASDTKALTDKLGASQRQTDQLKQQLDQMARDVGALKSKVK